MKIEKITYQRVRNLGDYETERLEVSAEVGETEDPKKSFEDLKKWVHIQLGLLRKPSEEEYESARQIVDAHESWE